MLALSVWKQNVDYFCSSIWFGICKPCCISKYVCASFERECECVSEGGEEGKEWERICDCKCGEGFLVFWQWKVSKSSTCIMWLTWLQFILVFNTRLYLIVNKCSKFGTDLKVIWNIDSKYLCFVSPVDEATNYLIAMQISSFAYQL